MEWLDKYNKRIDYDWEYDEVSLIKKGLYISNRKSVTIENIKTYGINAVLSLGIENKLPEKIVNPLEAYICLDILDDVNEVDKMHQILNGAYSFISRNKTVLVHCKDGMSRSPTAVIYYLIKKYKLDPLKTIKYVKKRRKCIYPNPCFIRLLLEL